MGSTYARLPVVEPLSPAANDAQVPSRQALPRGPSTNSSANAINNNINANAIATLTRVFLIVYPGLVVSTLVLGELVIQCKDCTSTSSNLFTHQKWWACTGVLIGTTPAVLCHVRVVSPP